MYKFGWILLLVLYNIDYVMPRENFIPEDLLTSTIRPCNSFQQPKKPDFTKYNYRVSERKCLEYLLEMYNRLEEIKRLEICSGAMQVVRGGDVKPADYPHMGAVGWRRRDNSLIFLCGSSLISPKFVLTAAHCTEASRDDLASSVPSVVRFGNNVIENNDFSPIIDVNIKRVITNPHFYAPYKYFDIALFELEKELKFNKFVQPACLWSKRRVDNIRDKITITGWGATDPDQTVLNADLKVADVNIIKTKTCNKLLEPYCSRNFCGVKSHQICAGNLKGGADTCFGDSGGPLQFRLVNTTDEGQISMVIGVTAFGISARKCGQEYAPGIYTKVYSFIDWIESEVWPGER